MPLKIDIYSNLDKLGSGFEAIHRAVEGLLAMEEELKRGGNAIRAFYMECHLPLLQQFLVLLLIISKCFNK